MSVRVEGLNSSTRCLESLLETPTSCFILSSDDEERGKFFLIIWQQTGYPLHRRTKSRKQGVVPGSGHRRPDYLCSRRAFWTRGAPTNTLQLWQTGLESKGRAGLSSGLCNRECGVDESCWVVLPLLGQDWHCWTPGSLCGWPRTVWMYLPPPRWVRCHPQTKHAFVHEDNLKICWFRVHCKKTEQSEGKMAHCGNSKRSYCRLGAWGQTRAPWPSAEEN